MISDIKCILAKEDAERKKEMAAATAKREKEVKILKAEKHLKIHLWRGIMIFKNYFRYLKIHLWRGIMIFKNYFRLNWEKEEIEVRSRKLVIYTPFVINMTQFLKIF